MNIVDHLYLHGEATDSSESVEEILRDFDNEAEVYEAAYRLWLSEESWWNQIQDLLP